jgi:hypothetical protein
MMMFVLFVMFGKFRQIDLAGKCTARGPAMVDGMDTINGYSIGRVASDSSLNLVRVLSELSLGSPKLDGVMAGSPTAVWDSGQKSRAGLLVERRPLVSFVMISRRFPF